MIQAKTVRWQCSGCDHLCAMLVDQSISPRTLTICSISAWRVVENPDNAKIKELEEEIRTLDLKAQYHLMQGDDGGL